MKRTILAATLALVLVGAAQAGQNVRNGTKLEFLIDEDTVLVRASVKEVKKVTFIQCSYFDAITNDYLGQAKSDGFVANKDTLLDDVADYCTGAWPSVESSGTGRS